MGIDDEAKIKQPPSNSNNKATSPLLPTFMEKETSPPILQAQAKWQVSLKANYSLYQKRISLALEQLKAAGAQSTKIAVIGYCFGGTGALETARAGLEVVGVVSIHGGLGKAADRPNLPIKTKVFD